MAGVTIKEDFTITAREVDFVTKFADNWQALRDILGIMRPVKKAPGTVLKSKYAELTLESGSVEEGGQIPYSEALVKEKTYGTITIKKYAKAVSIESIETYGYDAAINLTDKQFLYELQSDVMDAFYDYIQTGELTDTQATFQMALSMAQGKVRDKWRKMKKGITNVVGFCNILDAYEYLGAANISVQSQFGMNYIENFLGYSKLFLSSEIPSGKIIATPVENIVLYYVDPADSDFARAGLQYRTDGETNLIGFHVNGNYGTAVSESFAIHGLVLFAEYIDGICVETIDASPFDTLVVASDDEGATYPWTSYTPADFQSNVTVRDNNVYGTMKFIEGGLSPSGYLSGDGYFLALKFSGKDAHATSFKVGLKPTQGAGMQELDEDMNAVFKITDKNVQKLCVQVSDGTKTRTDYYDLSTLRESKTGA